MVGGARLASTALAEKTAALRCCTVLPCLALRPVVGATKEEARREDDIMYLDVAGGDVK